MDAFIGGAHAVPGSRHRERRHAPDGVILTRRTLLRGAARVGAALAAGPAWADALGLPYTVCTTGGGLRQVTLRSPQSAPVAMLHPDSLARFVDPLSIPESAHGELARPIRCTPTQDYGGAIALPCARPGPACIAICRQRAFWGYNGLLPGPTLETRTGQPLLIESSNELPSQHLLPIDHSLHGAGRELPEVRAVVHVHGARVPPKGDGYPDHWYTSGKSAIYRYPNSQDATALWYHDHAMGIERLNVYAGLFGAFLIRDEFEESLHLPRGEHGKSHCLYPTGNPRPTDSSTILPPGCPRSPWVSEVYGDVVLMNGKVAPYLEVEPRPYRFRMVNASNARFYYIALSDSSPLQQIGVRPGSVAAARSQAKHHDGARGARGCGDRFRQARRQDGVARARAMELMQFRVAPRDAKPR